MQIVETGYPARRTRQPGAKIDVVYLKINILLMMGSRLKRNVVAVRWQTRPLLKVAYAPTH